MSVFPNHTIVKAGDKRVTARFLAQILGLPEPTPYGPFLVVQVDNEDDPDGHILEILTVPCGG